MSIPITYTYTVNSNGSPDFYITSDSKLEISDMEICSELRHMTPATYKGRPLVQYSKKEVVEETIDHP